MKKIFFLFITLCFAYILPGCKVIPRDAKGVADSLNKSKETTVTKEPGDGIAVNLSDARFATSAAVDGMYGTGMAKLALLKTSNPKIKKIATAMVTDYTSYNNDLVHISKIKKITLPAGLDDDHENKMGNLSSLNGENFDRVYIALMISNQKKAHKLFDNEIKTASDKALKSFAVKNAPIIQAHLDVLHKAHDNI